LNIRSGKRTVNGVSPMCTSGRESFDRSLAFFG
jgi:hypothetical protein